MNNHNNESQPRKINPEDVDFTPPSKKLKSQEKIDIDESELGREQGQTPADEHIIDEENSQIDPETIRLQKEKANSESTENSLKDEINDDDVRDQGDSTKDWDAENSRTGRHK